MRRVLAPAPLPDRAADEIIARGVSADDLAQLQTDGFVLIEQRAPTGGVNLIRLRKPGPLDLDAARAAARARASGTSAEFKHFYRTEQGAGQAGDTCPGGLCLARQVIAWQPVTGCGPLPAVGMVDTGVNADHATFAQADLTVHSLDPAAERARATASDALHGTAVAALLVGAPDTRSPGLIPGARLIAVDAFVRQGQDQVSDAVSLIAPPDWLGTQDLRLSNMSLAGPPNEELARQIALLVARDVLIVAAAGNMGPPAPRPPIPPPMTACWPSPPRIGAAKSIAARAGGRISIWPRPGSGSGRRPRSAGRGPRRGRPLPRPL